MSSLEGRFLDFRTDELSDKESHQDLAEAAVCFANASGGEIVIVVADSTVGPEAFVGTRLDRNLLRSGIHYLTEPPLGLLHDQVTGVTSAACSADSVCHFGRAGIRVQSGPGERFCSFT